MDLLAESHRVAQNSVLQCECAVDSVSTSTSVDVDVIVTTTVDGAKVLVSVVVCVVVTVLVVVIVTSGGVVGLAVSVTVDVIETTDIDGGMPTVLEINEVWVCVTVTMLGACTWPGIVTVCALLPDSHVSDTITVTVTVGTSRLGYMVVVRVSVSAAKVDGISDDASDGTADGTVEDSLLISPSSDGSSDGSSDDDASDVSFTATPVGNTALITNVLGCENSKIEFDANRGFSSATISLGSNSCCPKLWRAPINTAVISSIVFSNVLIVI
ncbi:hypothetical protein BX070DRAFT_247501 [Coemansia spiralis]|nr:hypothetical protein BX070DRAFT_247501 [Coemansia spiralis]